jgi:hypothetical protein
LLAFSITEEDVYGLEEVAEGAVVIVVAVGYLQLQLGTVHSTGYSDVHIRLGAWESFVWCSAEDDLPNAGWFAWFRRDEAAAAKLDCG